MESQKKQPFFSIVMPAYKVEKYIGKAIKSILRQTFPDWELIVVDDCSPDSSREIAAAYAKEDDRICVLCQEENRGVSAARNLGIEKASGKYIWFMDSDDHADSDLLEAAFESLKRNPARLVVFGLQEEYYGRDGTFRYRHEILPKERYYADKESLRKEIIYLEQSTLYGYVWNKMYELEYLRALNMEYVDYEDAKFIEDILFNVKYCMDIDSMNILAAAPYHYQKRLDDSLTNEFVPDYYRLHRKRIQMIYKQYRYWNLCTDEVRQILGSLYGRYLLSALQRNCDPRSHMNCSARYHWCRRVVRQPLFEELIPYARSKDSKTLAAALCILKRKNIPVCLLMGRIVYMCKEKLPTVYSKIKSGR